MKKQKSEAQLKWEQQYRQQRSDEKWERAEEFFSQPMFLSPRSMAPRSPSEEQQSPGPRSAQAPSARQL